MAPTRKAASMSLKATAGSSVAVTFFTNGMAQSYGAAQSCRGSKNVLFNEF